MPAVSKPGKNAEAAAYRNILEDDARHLAAFVERWRPRVATVTHARHRTMLGVVLGESVEHQRLFEQAGAGLEDVIGRRTAGADACRRRPADALAGVDAVRFPVVAIALGSNLGDRDGHLRAALEALRPFVESLRVSSFHDTAPVGVGDQPIFLNAVAMGETTLLRAGVCSRCSSISRSDSAASGPTRVRHGRSIWI